MQNLMMVNTTLGCCAAEILQGLVETMYVFIHDAYISLLCIVNN